MIAFEDSFINELNNRITICVGRTDDGARLIQVIGPTSMSENILTEIEFQKLAALLQKAAV